MKPVFGYLTLCPYFGEQCIQYLTQAVYLFFLPHYFQGMTPGNQFYPRKPFLQLHQAKVVYSINFQRADVFQQYRMFNQKQMFIFVVKWKNA